MKVQSPWIPAILAIALAGTACDKSEQVAAPAQSESPAPVQPQHEDIVNQVLDSVDEVAAILEDVTDMDTANAGLSRMEQVNDRLAVLTDKLVRMAPPSDEVKQKISSNAKVRFQKAADAIDRDLKGKKESLSEEAHQIYLQAFQAFEQKMRSLDHQLRRHFAN